MYVCVCGEKQNLVKGDHSMVQGDHGRVIGGGTGLASSPVLFLDSHQRGERMGVLLLKCEQVGET